MKKITNYLFVFTLLVFGILIFVMPSKSFSDNENRTLEQLPSLSIKNILSGKYMDNFSEFTQDQFFLRDQWVELKCILELAAGKKENNGIFITDEALISKFEQNDLTTFHLNNQAINNLDVDVDVTVLLAPTIAAIYPEYLPEYNQETDQFDLIEKAQQEINTRVVDVSDILLEHKDEPIYFTTDHHWTSLGAYYAYCDLMGKEPQLADYEMSIVSTDFKGTSYSYSGAFWREGESIAVYRNDVMKQANMVADGKEYDSIFVEDNLQKKDQYTYFLDGNHAYTTLSNGQGEKNLLIIKDSYAHDFVGYLLNDYASITVVDLRYYYQSISELVKNENIDEILILYNIVNYTEDENLQSME